MGKEGAEMHKDRREGKKEWEIRMKRTSQERHNGNKWEVQSQRENSWSRINYTSR